MALLPRSVQQVLQQRHTAVASLPTVACSRQQARAHVACHAAGPEQPGNRGTSDDQALVLNSLQQAARLNPGRTGKLNMVFASDRSEDTWRRLDQKVNKYPGQRSFTAIGTGGSAFRTSMVNAVERVVGTVHCECVSQRTSRGGSYISVTVGPVMVENGEQVLEIYHNMKEDSRLKWFI